MIDKKIVKKFVGKNIHNKHSKKAFTLLELLFALAIIAILSFGVGPSVSNHLQLNTQINEIKSTIEFAKNLSIEKGTLTLVAFADENLGEFSLRAYAVFVASPAGFLDENGKPIVELHDSWKILPEGLIFSFGDDYQLADEEKKIYTINEIIEKDKYFVPIDSLMKKNNSVIANKRGFVALPYFAFNNQGNLIFPPISKSKNYHYVGTINGFYDNVKKSRTITNKETNDKARSTLLKIYPYTAKILKVK